MGLFIIPDIGVIFRIPKVYETGSNRLLTMGNEWGRRKRSRALVRNVSPNFQNALANYFGTGPTDVHLSQAAHDDYVSALKENGVDVDVLPGIADHPDCTFVEDTVIVVDDVVVIANMGHHSREGEQVGVESFLSEYLEVVRMPEGALMYGGDVVFFDDRFLVGLSTRTNKAGAAFLREVAAARGYGVMEFDVPQSTLHLTTVCSSPVPGVIVAAEGHLTREQFQPLVEEGFDVLWVPNEESYASNMIGFENGNVIISADYPVTQALLEALGYSIRSVDMTHIRAADGSLTCLSIFFQ
jgi:dimethylargininase